MATVENVGRMTFLDADGNENLLYPITKAEAVKGLEKASVANAANATNAGNAKTATTATSATKATQDGNGANIAATYRKKSEGSVVHIGTTAPTDTTMLWVVPS